MSNRINIFEELMFNSDMEGKNIVLKNVNLDTVFISDEVICPMYINSWETESNNVLWILLNDEVLSDFFGEEKYELVKSDFQEKKNGFIIFEDEPYFLYNMNIEGYYSNFKVPTEGGMKTEKGIVATKIYKSSKEKDWKRGSIFLDSNDNDDKIAFLSDDLKDRIGEALKPYHDSLIFDYLFAAISKEFNPSNDDPKELFLSECSKCGKPFIIHKMEISDEKDLDNLSCRECGDWIFDSIKDIPSGTPFLIKGYYTLKKGLHGEGITYDEIGRIATLEHDLEIGVTLVSFRKKIKEMFHPRKYKYMEVINEAILEAQNNNPSEFKRLLNDLDNLSSKMSLQTTKDISRVNKQISDKFSSEAFDFMYPHPMKEENELLELDSILLERFTDQINLYKDVYDLYSDHLFIANLGRIIKGKKYDPNCISENLFGKRLVDKTLEHIKGTRLKKLIKNNYDNKLRNSIGHPGRYIDISKGEVELYNKGELKRSLPWKEFLEKVNKVTDVHMELIHAKYRLAMLDDKEFLATGGIISLQPDIFENPKNNNEVIPTIVVNQQWCFEQYSPPVKWWTKNLNITSKVQSGKKIISVSIPRENSKYADSPDKRVSEFIVTDFIEEWAKEVLNMGYIQVVYCKCYLSIDFMDKEELTDKKQFFGFIPHEVPLDFASGNRQYLITHMDISGKINLTDKIEENLKRIT